MTKRRTPRHVYVALDQKNDVVGLNTNLQELRDESSRDWHVILRYASPRIVAERKERARIASCCEVRAHL